MSYANKGLELYLNGIEQLRWKLFKSYSSEPMIDFSIRAAWAIGYLFAVSFAVGILLLLPAEILGSESLRDLAGYSAVGAGFIFVGVAWLKARNDRQDVEYTGQLTYEPITAADAAEAVGYLEHENTYARQNAMCAVAIASRDGAGRIVSQIPDHVEAEDVVWSLVNRLFDENIQTRAHAAQALPHFGEEYPEVVALEGERLRKALPDVLPKDASAEIGVDAAGNVAWTLGYVGQADE